MEKEEYLTVEQISDKLQVHWQTVLSYIRKGQLKAFKLGKGYRVAREDFEAFISALKEQK